MLRFENVAIPFASVICVAFPENKRLRCKNEFGCTAIGTFGVCSGFPPLPSNCTVTGGAIVAPAAASVGCCTKASLFDVAAIFVRLKVAGPAAPVVVAVTGTAPVCELAVIADELAMPFESVIPVADPL